jgi:hypothetical protein
MEIRKNNFNDPDRAGERDDERLEGFSASEMADRGPKDVLKDRSQYADTDAAAIRPVSNVNGEEGDEDYDDEEDDTDDLVGDEEVDLDEDDLDEEDFDDEDLDDIELDDDEEEDEDDNL